MAPKPVGGGARQRVSRQAGGNRSRSRSPPPSASSSSTTYIDQAGGTGGGARQRLQRLQRTGVACATALGDVDSGESGSEFRNHLAKLFLESKFSGPETLGLVRKAQKAGAGGVEDLACAGAAGTHQQNASRDLMSKLLRGCFVPEVYWASVPLLKKGLSTPEETLLPMLLPHEMVANMVGASNIHQFCNLAPSLVEVHEKVCRTLRVDPARFLALGLHGDGVPHQKRKSIEVVSWNCLGAQTSDRFLPALVEKDFCCNCGCSGRHTLERILEVFCWSMKCLIQGAYPAHRHDGTAFGPSDKTRSTLVSKPLPCRAGLLQVRGDWAWYKQVFAFPGWNNKSICWRCPANRDDKPYWDFSLSAAWRKGRYSEQEFWSKQRANNVSPSCLFALPGMSLEFVCIDVLHAMDLGVSQDAIGNVLWEALTSGMLEGGTLEQCCASLWAKLRKHYAIFKSPNRLQNLTVEMIKKVGKGPKLRAKGAETRGMVPFALECAIDLHAYKASTHSLTVLQCMSSLMDFYTLMSLDEYPPEVGAKACRKFNLLYHALSQESAQNGYEAFWKLKPKHHMFAEMAEYQAPSLGNPSAFWNYADEDFVGWVAKLASSKGGPTSAATTAKKVLEKYRALGSL